MLLLSRSRDATEEEETLRARKESEQGPLTGKGWAGVGSGVRVHLSWFKSTNSATKE